MAPPTWARGIALLAIACTACGGSDPKPGSVNAGAERPVNPSDVVLEIKAARAKVGAYRATYKVQGDDRARTVVVAHQPPLNYRVEFDGGCVVLFNDGSFTLPQGGLNECPAGTQYQRVDATSLIEAIVGYYNALIEVAFKNQDDRPEPMRMVNELAILGKPIFGIAFAAGARQQPWMVLVNSAKQVSARKTKDGYRVRVQGHEISIDAASGLVTRWTMDAAASAKNAQLPTDERVRAGELSKLERGVTHPPGHFDPASFKPTNTPTEAVTNQYLGTLITHVLPAVAGEASNAHWTSLPPEQRAKLRATLRPHLVRLFKSAFGDALVARLKTARTDPNFCPRIMAVAERQAKDAKSDADIAKVAAQQVVASFSDLFGKMNSQARARTPANATWLSDAMADMTEVFVAEITEVGMQTFQSALAYCRARKP